VILSAAVRGGVSAVRGAVRLAAGAGSHAAWWLDHKLGGSPRNSTADESRRAPSRER
jgi:hypothetical protein